MVVVGEELFICDWLNDALQVYSIAGEHLREITGQWARPLALCVVADRLYLVEEAAPEEEEEEEGDMPLFEFKPGRRIVVMSLQGATLQVYTNPVEGHTFSHALCYFDGKLLAPVKRKVADPNGRPSMEYVGVMAFSGAESRVVYCAE